MLLNLILIFCAYLPFQIALNPLSGVDLASSRIFILLLFLIWLTEGLRKKKLAIRDSKANFFLVTFLFLNLISVVVARNTDWSLRKLLFLFSVFPLYFAVQGIVGTREKAEKVIKVLVWSGAAVAVLGVVQFFAQFIFGLDSTYDFWARYVSPVFLGRNVTEAVLKNPSWLVNIVGQTYLRAVAVFPDPHMLAFFLGMLLPFAWFLFRSKKSGPYLVAFSVILLADLLTFSRGGYLGLFAGAAVVISLLLERLEKRHKLWIIGIVGGLGMLLAVPGPINQRFFSSFNLKEGSNAGRLATWHQAIGVIGKYPLLGVGIGNYPLQIDPLADYRDPIYAHSLYLDIAAETGLIDLAVWIGFVAVMIGGFLKRSRDGLCFAALISLVIFSAHALVETPLYSPTVLPLFLIVAALSGIYFGKAVTRPALS